MCFKWFFNKNRKADNSLASHTAEKNTARASQKALELLSTPMNSRPLKEQIRDFIHNIEQPQYSEIQYRRNEIVLKTEERYSLPDDELDSSIKYSLREESLLNGEQFSFPKGKPDYGGQTHLPDQWHSEYEVWQAAHNRQQTFREFILDSLEKKGINPVAFYTAADIDRKLFSRMKNEPDYRPSKDTAIRCCLALKLNIEQTEYALSLAGYSLSWSLHEDLAVRWCIQHRVFKVYDVMEVVEELKGRVL